MNLKIKLPISESEKKLLKKVIKLSCSISLALVVIVWVVQFIRIKRVTSGLTFTMNTSNDENKSASRLLSIDIDAHEFTADYYLNIDQPGKALPHLERIYPLKRDDRAYILKLATTLIQAGNYQKASSLLDELAAEKTTDSLSASIEARHGLALFHLGFTDESIRVLNECMGRYPNSAEAACYLGELHAALSIPSDSAEYYFSKALAIDPDYSEALYQAARYYMKTADYKRARLLLSKILEKEPLHIRAHSRLGMVYFYLEKPQLARKEYETALALNPGDYNTHYNLGELYFSSFDNKEAALMEFKKALRGKPDHAEANFKTGLICLENNMIKEAARYFEYARSAAPTNIRILLQLAVAYEKLDRPDDALRIYYEIKDLDGLNRIAMQKIKMLTTQQ